MFWALFLFIVYINDISNISCFHSKTNLFKNNMTVYLIDPSPEQFIMSANHEPKKLHQWCLSNTLTININKTHFMLFACKRKLNLPQLIINRNSIRRTNAVKVLFTYNETITFKHRINNVTLLLSRDIALLHHIKDYVPLMFLNVFTMSIYICW